MLACLDLILILCQKLFIKFLYIEKYRNLRSAAGKIRNEIVGDIFIEHEGGLPVMIATYKFA